MVGYGEGVVYLSAQGRPTDIGLQMGKEQERVEGDVFIFSVSLLSFLFSFFPVPLFHLLYYLFYLVSSFLWETAQNDPQGLSYR